ncbi:MAG: hypothetical protein HQM04_04745 [Magnetococcales bacterium]|nr:hypothetical protein [Magnetococcales bacterium]MBF0114333.1 hypothetical protein [Magnetococcales bacterium]
MAQVHSQRLDNLPLLRRCQFFPEPVIPEEVNAWVRQAGLRGAPAVGVLDRDAYLLFPADRPNLPRSEWGLNLRWKIADRLGYPAQEAVVETFALPGGASKSERIYVAVARSIRLQQEVALFHQAELRLQRLDIVELALGRLTDTLPEAETGVALLYWSGAGLLVILRRQGLFYLARLLENVSLDLWSPAPPAPATQSASDAVDHLAMELHRTLHFYQNSFAQPTPHNLYVLPMSPLCRQAEMERLQTREKYAWPGTPAQALPMVICEQLSKRLELTVQPLPLQAVLRWQDGVDEALLSCCLPALGALVGEMR